MKKAIKDLFNENIYIKISLMLSTVIFFVVFVSYYYTDLISLTVWSTNIWDTIADTGNFRNFYLYSAQNYYGIQHQMVGSDFLIYVPWAIWNIPIWAIQRFGHVAIVNNPLLLFYSKLFLFVVLLLLLKCAYKICLALNNQESGKDGMVFLISSAFVMFSIAYAGQNDILVIFVFVYALYNLIINKKRKFIIFAALAIALKPFIFLAFLAVILVIEKRIWRILLYIIESVSILILEKLIFLGAPFYKESLEYGPSKVSFLNMFLAQINFEPRNISVFILSLVVIYFMAYLSENQDNDSSQSIGIGSGYSCVYYSMAILMSYSALVYDAFYRPVYFIVFFSMVAAINKRYKRMNIILMNIYSLSFIVMSLIYDFFFFTPLFRLGVYEERFFSPIYMRLEQILSYDDSIVGNICNTICIASIIILSVINHPKFKYKSQVLEMPAENYIYVVGPLINVIPVALSLLFSVY